MELKERIALTDKEFYKEACRFCDAKNLGTATKWWEAFCEVIIRRLYFDKTVRLPLLGNFGLREIGESIQVQKDGKGKEIVYRVPAREVPVFYPSSEFIDDVNMTGVTKAYRRRLKMGNLTQRDYERQARAEAVNADGKMPERYSEASREVFKQYLEEKVKKFNEKVEPIDDDEE